jgi:GxxExxY protein
VTDPKAFEQKDAKARKVLNRDTSIPFLPARASGDTVMHQKFVRANARSREVIGAAIEVHRLKGPGLLESVYERCLVHELSLRGIPAVQQLRVPIAYKGIVFEEPLQLDLLVDDCLIVELKAVEKVLPIHKAQLLSYLHLLDIPLGLLINFHELRLVDGVHRMIVRGADDETPRG